MILSYRARQLLKRMFSVLLYILLIAVGLVLCWLLWLQRFILYTPEGVRLNFNLSQISETGVIPQMPENSHISIEYADEEKVEDGEVEEETPVQERMEGYYIEPTDLQENIPLVRSQLETLPAGTPVMLDVKSIWGYFFYSSSYGQTSNSYNIAEMDSLIAWLAESDLYVIARLPAFRDYYFGLHNVSCGLAVKQGYLWADSDGAYWLDPTDDGTLTHLIQIVKELRGLGFDEVVFKEFYIPDAESIVFSEDRTQALENAAQDLVTACATDSFTVSFAPSDTTLQIPESRSRLYLMNVAAADLADVLRNVKVADLEMNVVLVAQSYDTRYTGCGILHPLNQAQ